MRTMGTPGEVEVPGLRAFEGPARGFDRWVSRMLRERAPALVHQRHALDEGVPLSGAPCPWILEVNAPLVWEGALFRAAEPSRRRLARERATFAAADEVIAVSPALAAWCGGRWVPNGVPSMAADALPPRGALDERAHDPDAPYVLGYEGTFKPWHGLAGEVPRLAALIDAVGPVHVELAGDGPERAAVLAALTRHDVPYTWLGVLDPAGLRAARARWNAAWSPEAPWPPAGAASVARALGEPVPERWFAPLKEAHAAAAGLPLWKGGVLRAPAPPPPTWEDIAADLLARVGLAEPASPRPSGGRRAAGFVG